jgi:hypothetical protein
MHQCIENPLQPVRLAVAVLLCGLLASARAASPMDDVQKAATEWAKVRVETAKIETDWTWQQTLMQSTLDALQARVQQLEAKRTELVNRTAEERGDITEQTARRQAMKEAEAEAARHLVQLGDRLVRMRAWLPPRLSVALELPYRSLVAPDVSAGERMRQVMTILNRCAQFNRMVSTGEEMITRPDGEKRLMEVVYWGLSHSYALDRVGGAAYLGAPAEGGWAWTPLSGMAPQIARLLDASRDKAEPAFVVVPAQVSDPLALNSKP